MAHAQKPDFVFRRNGRVHLNRRGRQFSRLLAAEVCASAVVMLDAPCFEVVWRVLATHSIRQFPLHFPSRESQCAITFQTQSNTQCYNVTKMCKEQHCAFCWLSVLNCVQLCATWKLQKRGGLCPRRTFGLQNRITISTHSLIPYNRVLFDSW